MDYSDIFSPIRIGGRTLKSRLTHAKSGGGRDGKAVSALHGLLCVGGKKRLGYGMYERGYMAGL